MSESDNSKSHKVDGDVFRKKRRSRLQSIVLSCCWWSAVYGVLWLIPFNRIGTLQERLIRGALIGLIWQFIPWVHASDKQRNEAAAVVKQFGRKFRFWRQ